MGLSACFSSHLIRKDTRTGGGGGIRELPDDIIIDILSRLPAESVLKIRRVCKQWLALTCTPYFAKLHLKRSTATTNALLLQMITWNVEADKLTLFQLGEINTTKKKKTNKPPTLKKMIREGVVSAENEHNLIIRSSCDGFLVFQDVHSHSRFVVCNIVTREQVTFEAPIKGHIDSSPPAMFLHPITKEYMMLFQNPAQGKKPNFTRYDFYLYSFTSKSWRQISSFHHIPEYHFTPVVVNNTIHWKTSTRKINRYNPPCDSAIFTFDMITEELRVMPHPGNTCSHPSKHRLGVYIYEAERSLCLYWIKPHGKFADIWALEDYDNWRWAKKKTVDTNCNIFPGSIHLMSKEELVFRSNTQFLKINLHKNQQKAILIDETRKEFRRMMSSHGMIIFPITKSFVSLKAS